MRFSVVSLLFLSALILPLSSARQLPQANQGITIRQRPFDLFNQVKVKVADTPIQHYVNSQQWDNYFNQRITVHTYEGSQSYERCIEYSATSNTRQLRCRSMENDTKPSSGFHSVALTPSTSSVAFKTPLPKWSDWCESMIQYFVREALGGQNYRDSNVHVKPEKEHWYSQQKSQCFTVGYEQDTRHVHSVCRVGSKSNFKHKLEKSSDFHKNLPSADDAEHDYRVRLNELKALEEAERRDVDEHNSRLDEHEKKLRKQLIDQHNAQTQLAQSLKQHHQINQRRNKAKQMKVQLEQVSDKTKQMQQQLEQMKVKTTTKINQTIQASDSSPSQSPNSSPTQTSTSSPTQTPTSSPTQTPTSSPTQTPTSSPTQTPNDAPNHTPNQSPNHSPITRLKLRALTQFLNQKANKHSKHSESASPSSDQLPAASPQPHSKLYSHNDTPEAQQKPKLSLIQKGLNRIIKMKPVKSSKKSHDKRANDIAQSPFLNPFSSSSSPDHDNSAIHSPSPHATPTRQTSSSQHRVDGRVSNATSQSHNLSDDEDTFYDAETGDDDSNVYASQ